MVVFNKATQMQKDADTLHASTRASIRSFLQALQTFRELSPTMPVGEVSMFLSVALNEGASLTELAEEADMKKSTSSRYLLDLSDKTRDGGSGYGLVQREADPKELRRNMYSLSPKGRDVVRKLVSVTPPRGS